MAAEFQEVPDESLDPREYESERQMAQTIIGEIWANFQGHPDRVVDFTENLLVSVLFTVTNGNAKKSSNALRRLASFVDENLDEPKVYH